MTALSQAKMACHAEKMFTFFNALPLIVEKIKIFSVSVLYDLNRSLCSQNGEACLGP